MIITWYGHACFRLEARSGTSLVTDPYSPGASGLPPIGDSADFVVRSSPDDDYHSCAEMVPGAPHLIEALDLGEYGTHAAGDVEITALRVMESTKHKSNPAPNAMFVLRADGLSVLHMGDVGNPISDEHLAWLEGTVDILLPPVGGPPTIELSDLSHAIDRLAPKIVIPMHYEIPHIRGDFLPVENFLSRYAPEMIEHAASSSITFELPPTLTDFKIVVLEPRAIAGLA